MTETKSFIDKAYGELKQERDELRVKVKLAKMEALEEWQEIEEKLVKLELKSKQLGKTTVEVSKDVSASARLLINEISDGFKRIIKKL